MLDFILAFYQINHLEDEHTTTFSRAIPVDDIIKSLLDTTAEERYNNFEEIELAPISLTVVVKLFSTKLDSSESVLTGMLAFGNMDGPKADAISRQFETIWNPEYMEKVRIIVSSLAD